MIEVLYKKKLLNINHIWFYNGEVLKNKSYINIYHAPKFFKDNNYLFMKEQHTLIHNLKTSEDEILKNINKTYRYDIRRAEKDGIETKYFSSFELLDPTNTYILKKFYDTYNSMYKEKGLKQTINIRLVKSYIKNNCFILSVAFYNNNPLVFHSYIIDIDQVRLLHSCSNFRTDVDLKEIIGRMNKYLHWKDLLFFKKDNYETFDWGGISIDSNNGISDFKKKFGGNELNYYNYIVIKNKIISYIAKKILYRVEDK